MLPEFCKGGRWSECNSNCMCSLADRPELQALLMAREQFVLDLCKQGGGCIGLEAALLTLWRTTGRPKQCSVVFLGDSVSAMQASNAARCQLRSDKSGFSLRPSRGNVSVPVELEAWMAHPSLNSTQTRGRLAQLGACSVVLYSEGLWFGGFDIDAASARKDVDKDSMSHELQRGQERRGAGRTRTRGAEFAAHVQRALAVVLEQAPTSRVVVWEMAAQHFRTTTGDGRFEHADPPAAFVTQCGCSGGERACVRKVDKSWKAECSDHTGESGASDWRNGVLAQAAAHAQWVRQQRARSAGERAVMEVHFVPFYGLSRRWGSLVKLRNTKDYDCTHVSCYAAAFWIPLWDSIALALAAPAADGVARRWPRPWREAWYEGMPTSGNATPMDVRIKARLAYAKARLAYACATMAHCSFGQDSQSRNKVQRAKLQANFAMQRRGQSPPPRWRDLALQ